MNTIQNLFQQAQLAEAAYTNLTSAIGNQTAFKQALDVANGGSFSPAQAAAFVTDWRVVDQYTATGLFGQTWTGTGFSATLFQNITTGAYSFAIRGSTQLNDFVADAALIAADGTAPAQVVDMYNYWQHLNAPAGAIYDAAVLMPVADFQRGQYTASQLIYDSLSGTYSTIKFVKSNTLSDTTLQTGSGALAVCPANINVEGHSLGGHLAMAFLRLFPAAANNVTAVNGLGFKIGDANWGNGGNDTLMGGNQREAANDASYEDERLVA
jgi:hypothetical protein